MPRGAAPHMLAPRLDQSECVMSILLAGQALAKARRVLAPLRGRNRSLAQSRAVPVV